MLYFPLTRQIQQIPAPVRLDFLLKGISLPAYKDGNAERAIHQPLDITKEVDTMATYSDLFTFVIMLYAVVTFVVTVITRKKQRPW